MRPPEKAALRLYLDATVRFMRASHGPRSRLSSGSNILQNLYLQQAMRIQCLVWKREDMNCRCFRRLDPGGNTSRRAPVSNV